VHVRRLVIIALIVILLGGGLWLWKSRHPAAPADELVLYGNVDIRQVQLAFNNSERIASLLVQEGDRVKKGQQVATLDTLRLKQTVVRADEQVRAQKEIVARLEAGTRPEDIRKARADAEALEAEANNARANYRRQDFLLSNLAVSQQQAENARAAAEAAEARLNAGRETLQLAVAGPRKEDITSATATLKAYEAERAFAARQLADAVLYAPADGVIQDRIMEPGDMASPQKPVYTVALTNPLWVRAYVPERDLGKIRLGMAAEVTTDSYPGKRYQSWIGFISPTAEFSPKSVETPQLRTSLVYQARVYVCDPEHELRLGMPATVIIPLGQSLPAKIAVPSDPCRTP
jgi:HlyD family secretion protein